MFKLKVWLLCFFVLLLGVSGGLFSARVFMASYPKLLCGKSCQNQVTVDRKFFSDTLWLSGQAGEGKPFLLQLDLNRKKVGNIYQHYYFANFVYGDSRQELYTSFTDPASDIKPSDFLKEFKVNFATDLSTRESYSLTFAYGNLRLEAEVKNFSGDFIVKNSLEYTKYISEGRADGKINGSNFNLNAALQKIYSPDYAKYIFFDGYDNLDSLAQFFALWDKDGNFYLLDTSDVYSSQENYKPHTWALYKNHKESLMKKAFFAKVVAERVGWTPRSWNIDIPDIQASFTLAPSIFFSAKQNSGLAVGLVNTSSGTKEVEGYFSFEKYGE